MHNCIKCGTEWNQSFFLNWLRWICEICELCELQKVLVLLYCASVSTVIHVLGAHWKSNPGLHNNVCQWLELRWSGTVGKEGFGQLFVSPIFDKLLSVLMNYTCLKGWNRMIPTLRDGWNHTAQTPAYPVSQESLSIHMAAEWPRVGPVCIHAFSRTVKKCQVTGRDSQCSGRCLEIEGYCFDSNGHVVMKARWKLPW